MVQLSKASVYVDWHGRMKSISVSDNGQLSSSHGSLEGEEDSSNGKRGVKVLNNLKSSSSSLPSTITTTTTPSTSSSSSVCEENGIHDESEINMEEHLDPTLLQNMSKEDLMSHYKNEITRLKRNHDLKIRDMTELHFSHMRELLRERGPSLTIKKNKEFDMLRRRNSEVISKVDENEEVATLLPHTFGSNEEGLINLKGRLELLLSENQQLKDLLEDKEREIKCLSLQVSEAADQKTSQESLAEAKLLKTTANLKAAIEDARIEALIGEDLFAGILKEVVDEIKCNAEESQVENSIIHGIYNSGLKEAFCNAEDEEDLNMESIIMQDVCYVVFKDTFKDAEEKLNNLNNKYIDEYELRVLHETEKREKEKQLEVEIAKKEILKQEVLFPVQEKEQLARHAVAALAIEQERYEEAAQELRNLRGETCQQQKLKQEVLFLVQEKEQLARHAVAALAIEQERYEEAAQELRNLRGETCQQQKLISESVEESNAAKRDLVEALQQIEIHKVDICKLERILEVAAQELENLRGETCQQKKLISESIQESNDAKRDLVEAQEQIERHKVDMCKLERILEVAAQELENLRGETCQQKKLISESIEESSAAKLDLVEALEQIEGHKVDICKLEHNFQGAMTKLREVDEHRRMLFNANQQKQIAVSMFEEKERELRKQFETMSVYVGGLLKAVTDFESRVTQDISGKCSRLKSLTSQLHLLKQRANALVRQGILYKQRLEKKCSDLEKAEAEVDLLADKVDTVLNLAEKIYIGLDHYSPILQHYPGITEILKLLRRELSAEIKSV